jgi:quinohemoprotein ethanol dehydrogenase
MKFRFRRSLLVSASLAVAVCVIGIGQATGSAKKGVAITPPPNFTGSQMAAYPTDDWIDSMGNSFGDHYSQLNQINTSNVAQLHTVWHTNLAPSGGGCLSSCSQSASGIEYKGILYFPSDNDNVYAIDAATGQILWQYSANLVPGTYVDDGGGVTTRGVAVGDGMVFLARLDDIDVGLNATTGAVVWQDTLDSYTNGAFQTASPSYIGWTKTPEVVVGVAGGEIGVRGYVEALAAKTGSVLWKTFLVPGPGDANYGTWGDDFDIAHGGASVWTKAVSDSTLGTVIVGAGNASPYVNRAPGIDLYTASDVALDANTGKIDWYFQTVHHDNWDDDLANTPIIINYYKNGQKVEAVDQASKMGYNFIIDAKTGKPLIPTTETPQPVSPQDNASNGNSLTQPIPSGNPFSQQCATAGEWVANGGNPNLLGSDGQPIAFGCVYTPLSSNNFTAPGFHDVADWPYTSYNPKTALVYVCSTNDRIDLYKATALANAAPVVGKSYTEVSGSLAGDWIVGKWGVVSAINPDNNKIRWQLNMPDGNGCYSGTSSAGTTSGKTDVLFVGETNGHLLGVNAKTGAVLWTSPQLAAAATADAIMYELNGHEYVTMIAGGTSASSKSLKGADLYSFALPDVPTIST